MTTSQSETGVEEGVIAVHRAFPQQTDKQSELRSGQSVSDMLRDVAKPNGLLLMLDEAQGLGMSLGQYDPVRRTIGKNLDQIYNGKIGAPVVLLAAGLGITKRVFDEFNISRFSRRRVNELGRLDDKEVEAVFKDWLVQSGGAPENDPHMSGWVTVLAAECQGWPQHVNVCARAAAQWLLNHGSILPAEVPASVLSQARQEREDYYEDRVEVFEVSDVTILANLLCQKGEGELLTYDEVVDAYSADRSPEEAQEMFYRLLHKGVLARCPRDYDVPIPYMRSWLMREFAGKKQALSPPSPPLEVLPEKRDGAPGSVDATGKGNS